jgi:serine/threonine protein kinase
LHAPAPRMPTPRAPAPQVDMWSAGVVLFILLGGYPPFWSESEPALFEMIRRARFSFDDPVWGVVSDRCACVCLRARPSRRGSRPANQGGGLTASPSRARAHTTAQCQGPHPAPARGRPQHAPQRGRLPGAPVGDRGRRAARPAHGCTQQDAGGGGCCAPRTTTAAPCVRVRTIGTRT